MEQMLLKKKKALQSPKSPPEQKEAEPYPGSQTQTQTTNHSSQSSGRGVKYASGDTREDDQGVKMRGKQGKNAWVKQQKKAFTGWINAHLQSRQMWIDDLQTDIPKVAPLIHLLEILEKKPLKEITKYHKKPRHKFDCLDGMRICLKQIRSRGVKNIKVGFDAEDLLKGTNENLYLALAWRVIVNYAIQETTAEEVLDNKKFVFKTPEARLRWWCNKRLPEHLQIKNFTKNWSDAKVLVNLMNQALDENDRITDEDIEDMDTEELLEGILKLGDKHLHIPQLLDPYQVMTNPDKQAVMTYVSLLRTAIEAKDQERSAASASMKKMKDAFQNLEENWLQRVTDLEGRLEEAQTQQTEYAEKLQEERLHHAQQMHGWKGKTDKLYEEIEGLKSLILDENHEKEMQAQTNSELQQTQQKEIERLKKQIEQLTAQNEQLKSQLSQLMNEANQAKGNEQQATAYKMQLSNLEEAGQQQKLEYEKRIRELEALMAAQKKKFNDFYGQYKTKLESSNKAGREFREKCIVITSDTESLRKRIAELEALLKQKEKELDDSKKREKALLEQLATQETVFRIQLQELGQFIKEMKQREQTREKQQVEAYHKLLKEREARIAKDKERRRTIKKKGQNDKSANNLQSVDIEAQKAMLMKYERRKSQADDAYHLPKSTPSNDSLHSNISSGSHNNHNPLMDVNSPQSVNSPKKNGGKLPFDKKTEAVRTKFGNEKIITTWNYTGKDGNIHEVVLRHNTKSGKDQKSKRVIVVDGKVRYAEKSKETHFIIKNGKDQLKLNIAMSNGKQKGFTYQLFINDVLFQNLHNQYINSLAH